MIDHIVSVAAIGKCLGDVGRSCAVRLAHGFRKRGLGALARLLLAVELRGERFPVFLRLGESLARAVVIRVSSQLQIGEGGRIGGLGLFVFLLQIVHLMALGSDAMAGAQCRRAGVIHE
ncbi:hypothetical protein [Burkholderia sp. WP9]|uniref:hypothetical protein n=1 Tax=Burkholderia sp. WP9 TaxID=1500263 RepID=UPI00115FF9C1|nr:hypothetical protein [Burkholderia sp. WP9]